MVMIHCQNLITSFDPLPEFDNIIDMFVDGIKVVLVYLIYALVPLIIFFLFAAVSSSIGGYGESALMAIGAVITVANNGDSLSKAFNYKEIIEIIKSVGVTRSLGAYIGLVIICSAIYAVVFFLILFVFGFFGIFTGTLGFAMAAGGIFVAGFFIAYFVMLFIVGPYTMIMQSRVSGLLAIKSKRIVIQSSLSN